MERNQKADGRIESELSGQNSTWGLAIIALVGLVILVASWVPVLPISWRSVWGYAGLLGLTSAVGLSAKRIRSLNGMVIRDNLTGLYNRYWVHEMLRVELARADRYRWPLSLLFCDLDDFKQINDRNGHAAGDQVLKRIAQILPNTLRTFDVVARWGGDEFLIVLPHADQKAAEQIADRMCMAVASLQVPFPQDAGGQSMRVALSIGIATYPENGTDVNSLEQYADEKLYEAKRQRSSCVQLRTG